MRLFHQLFTRDSHHRFWINIIEVAEDMNIIVTDCKPCFLTARSQETQF